MGYWTQDRAGRSFAKGNGLWGDGPADAFDEALDKIVEDFKRDIGRLPSLNEIRAGLEFSLGIYKEDPSDLTHPPLKPILSEYPPVEA